MRACVACEICDAPSDLNLAGFGAYGPDGVQGQRPWPSLTRQAAGVSRGASAMRADLPRRVRR